MITYEYRLPHDINSFRRSVGWYELSPRQLNCALKSSVFAITALDGEKEVGSARVVGDGGYQFFISDVIVRPEYQGQGIGREMLSRLMDKALSVADEGETIMINLMALASTAAGSDFTFAWEGAVIAPTTPEAAVVFLNGVSEDNAKQAQEYADNEADAFTAAANGYVDRVITAEDTKSALTSAIEATSSKRVVTPAKKHVNFVY